MRFDSTGPRFRARVLVLTAYTAMSIAMNRRILLHLGTVLAHDAADPALNTWILWWDARIAPLTPRWWSPPIFWPVKGALAFSEHLFGISVFTTPLQWFGASALTAYNIAFLASFPLSALAMHALAFTVVKRHDAAFVAGLIFAFSPYRLAQAAHIQMMWVFWMPLALWAAHRFLETRRRGWLVVFAASWLLQALANGYYLLFFPVLLACWVLWFAMPRSRADALAIATVFTGASLLLVPFLLGYQRVHAALGLERGITEIVRFSADLTSVLATEVNVSIWGSVLRSTDPESALFPGFVALVVYVIAGVIAVRDARACNADRTSEIRPGWLLLAGAAALTMIAAITGFVLPSWKLAAGGHTLLTVSSGAKPLTLALAIGTAALLTTRPFIEAWRRRAPLVFYVCAAALMLSFALGPVPRFRGRDFLYRGPYWLLLQLQGFEGVRVPARFAMLFVLCLAVVAAIAFARLTSSFSSRRRAYAAAAVAALVIVESWSSVPVAASPAPIDLLLQTDASVPIVQLPFDADSDVAAVYRFMFHRRPLVNGYSGYVPPHYIIVWLALRLDDMDVLREFAMDTPIDFVVDRHAEFERWSALVERLGARRIADDSDWRLYRLDQQQRRPMLQGARLPIREVAANAGVDLVPQMSDGNPATAWNTQRRQAGGEQIEIDLGQNRDVDGIEMALDDFKYDFPRQLKVQCAADRAGWMDCWQGSGARLALRAVLDDARHPVLRVPINRAGVRRLRMIQTGMDPLSGWSISEIAVRGR